MLGNCLDLYTVLTLQGLLLFCQMVMHPRDSVLQSDWSRQNSGTGSNGLSPPMLPSSFLLVRGNEPGYEARYMCVVPDQVTLVDIYHQYASRRLDTQAEVPVELLTADNRSKNRI